MHIHTRLSKSESYVRSLEVCGIVNRRIGSWIVDRKILHYLRKKQKIHIGMLNNHINYTFIDIITIHHYIHLQASFKEAKNFKMWHSIRIFLFESNWHSLYIRVEKLSLLGFYFSFGFNWAFCQVKEDYKKPKLFRIVKIMRSYRSWTIAKILERSRSFWVGGIVKS